MKINTTKIHFMGYDYSLDEIRYGLATASKKDENDFDWDILPTMMQILAKEDPIAFSHFSREMHNLRFKKGTKKCQ